jgi:hypothetical protein
MFIKQLHVLETKKCDSASNRAEKGRFPREIGPCREIGYFDPLEFPRKTIRGPEESNRENRENAKKQAFPSLCPKGLLRNEGKIENAKDRNAETRKFFAGRCFENGFACPNSRFDISSSRNFVSARHKFAIR